MNGLKVRLTVLITAEEKRYVCVFQSRWAEWSSENFRLSLTELFVPSAKGAPLLTQISTRSNHITHLLLQKKGKKAVLNLSDERHPSFLHAASARSSARWRALAGGRVPLICMYWSSCREGLRQASNSWCERNCSGMERGIRRSILNPRAPLTCFGVLWWPPLLTIMWRYRWSLEVVWS